MTIKKFLNNKIFKSCQNVKINWIIYTNNNALYYENKTLKERFTNPDYKNPNNKHIKSTIRGNLPINYWYNMKNPHSSTNKFISCSSSGKRVSSSSPFVSPPDYKNSFLKHYRFKSFEEYCNKIKRSRSDFTTIENKKNIKKIYL